MGAWKKNRIFQDDFTIIVGAIEIRPFPACNLVMIMKDQLNSFRKKY